MITSALTLNAETGGLSYTITCNDSVASGHSMGFMILDSSGSPCIGSGGFTDGAVSFYTGSAFTLVAPSGTSNYSLKVFDIFWSAGSPWPALLDSATLTITAWLPPVVTNSVYSEPDEALSHPEAFIAAPFGSAFSYGITATSYAGHPNSYTIFGLPPGLELDSSSGVISGTPTGPNGNYPIGLGASNPFESGNIYVVIAVTGSSVPAGPPAITSLDAAVGTTGSPLSYQIVATNTPTSYGATGLPAGLSVNASTGLISGTPTAAASGIVVTLSATNSAGTGTLTLVLAIIQGPPPSITSAASANGYMAVAFNYQITATNTPASYAASGLPAGLSVNASTGLISGTPTAAGTFNATVSAANINGTGAEAVTLTIGPDPLPAITSPLAASAYVGEPFSGQIAATNNPTSYSAEGLPPGLEADGTTGIISGTPAAVGTYDVTLSATNGYGAGTAASVFTVSVPVPAILAGPYSFLTGDSPSRAIVFGAGAGIVDGGGGAGVPNNPDQAPVILRGPYPILGTAANPGIVLGAVPTQPASAASGSGSGGTGAPVASSDGYYYVTPYLRYSAGSPPQQQTLQSGVWTTVSEIA